MSEHGSDERYALRCLCGESWPCVADLERQLAEAQGEVGRQARVLGEFMARIGELKMERDEARAENLAILGEKGA